MPLSFLRINLNLFDVMDVSILDNNRIKLLELKKTY